MCSDNKQTMLEVLSASCLSYMLSFVLSIEGVVVCLGPVLDGLGRSWAVLGNAGAVLGDPGPVLERS